MSIGIWRSRETIGEGQTSVNSCSLGINKVRFEKGKGLDKNLGKTNGLLLTVAKDLDTIKSIANRSHPLSYFGIERIAAFHWHNGLSFQGCPPYPGLIQKPSPNLVSHFP
jgi:hypothetical protein